MAKYDNVPGAPGYYISRTGKLDLSKHIVQSSIQLKFKELWQEKK